MTRLASLAPLALLLPACAPALDPGDPWADVQPADPAAEVDLGLAAASLPLQLWLWLSHVDGCAPPTCPSVEREGDRVRVTTDCVDEQGVTWQGGALFEGEGTRRATLSDFGPEGLLLDGRQDVTAEDSRVEIESIDLAVALDEAPQGLTWELGPQSLLWPRHLVLLDEDGTWSVDGVVVLDAAGEAPRVLQVGATGWVEAGAEGEPERIIGQARLAGEGVVELAVEGDPWRPVGE